MTTSNTSGLSDVLAQRRVVVTVGSGGVGKTTTAAALALHAAMQGKKVLCLTIDPARRLANSLGLSAMTTDEQQVPASLFEQQGLAVSGTLSAMMLDTKRTFDDLVARHASSEETRDRILGNPIYQYMSSSLAGTQEYMAMEKLHEVRQTQGWDLIVLDTPPTTNALDFLDAPERLIAAIDSPAMRWFVQALEGSGGFGFNLVGKGTTILLKGLAKFTGVEFLEQVGEFVTGLNDLFGGFRERAEAVSSALRSPEVAFVLVTSPSPMAIREARFFSQRLDEAGMQQSAMVINAVHPLLAEPTASEKELLQALEKKMPTERKDTALKEVKLKEALSRMRQALEDERLQATSDRIESDLLKTDIGDQVRCVEVPALETDVHDLAALAEIAAYLTAPQ